MYRFERDANEILSNEKTRILKEAAWLNCSCYTTVIGEAEETRENIYHGGGSPERKWNVGTFKYEGQMLVCR